MAEIDKQVLRKLYPRGGNREKITMTLPAEIDARLRDMVAVGRGGEAGFLFALSLDMVMSVLEADDETWAYGHGLSHLRQFGTALAELGGRGDDVAASLRVMALEAENST